MTKSLSSDLRERIIAARAESSASEVSARFLVSNRTVSRLWKHYQETGNVSPKARGGYKKSRLENYRELLCKWVKEQPDITLAELRERLSQSGVTIGINALWHGLNRLGLTYKKNPARRRARAPRCES